MALQGYRVQRLDHDSFRFATFFLPWRLKAILFWITAAPIISKGIKNLFAGKITVDILDASAVAFSREVSHKKELLHDPEHQLLCFTACGLQICVTAHGSAHT
ncbi:MAG: hypothetical protein JRE64_01765 [Deltaproteobacteria bacterium]|nr:hypothetical protein [Deltaproteobacteria bacterium]